MAGFLGNLVVLLPNGISAFRFADGDDYDVNPMVLAGEALSPSLVRRGLDRSHRGPGVALSDG